MSQINWKYILIVAVLAAIVGGVALRCAQLRQELSYGPTVTITTPIPTSTPTLTPSSVTPSPSEKAVYWLNTEGELLKKEGETSTVLVSAAQDMEGVIQDGYSLGESFPYVKGKVLDFSLSPDENYIAYTALEYFTSCCMSPPTMPVASLHLMKNDGTEKAEIEKPQGIRDPLLVVDGWIPNSDRLLFHYLAPDAGTSYSLYFEVSPTEKTPKLYTEIFKFFKEGVEIDPKDVSVDDMDTMYLTVGDDPVYSPTGEKVSYLKYSEGADPYSRDTVRLKDIKTQETKTILENVKFEFGLALSILHWSDDGSLLLVEAVDKAYVFNKEGSAVFEGTVEEVINKFGAIFTNL